MSMFDQINEEAEKQETAKQEAIAELPEAYQIMSTERSRNQNGVVIKEVIMDTYLVDKKNGIIPVGKAKLKAKKLKEAYPDRSFYVVEIVHRIIATY